MLSVKNPPLFVVDFECRRRTSYSAVGVVEGVASEDPSGRIWIVLAVTLPSSLLVPVTVIVVPVVRSAEEPSVILLILETSEKKTSLEPPSGSLIVMLSASIERISPLTNPPPAWLRVKPPGPPDIPDRWLGSKLPKRDARSPISRVCDLAYCMPPKNAPPPTITAVTMTLRRIFLIATMDK